LGGSSCLAVSVLSALYAAREQLGQSRIPNEYELVQTAQDIEARVIRAPTGVQDYWGGIRGGINAIEFQPGRTRVNTFEASAVPSLEESMIVCYSGQSRQSAINNWEVFKRVFDGDQSLIQRLELIGREAESCAVALKSGDLSALLEHSQREWKLRVGLWPNIETERTRRIDLAAMAAGARFSRVCGAGGGGVMVIFADANIRAKVVAAATGAGGEILPAKISPQGVRLKFN
jgi:D-glycero-alpha-D-manno-heptose-7-phosphate kinase